MDGCRVLPGDGHPAAFLRKAEDCGLQPSTGVVPDSRGDLVMPVNPSEINLLGIVIGVTFMVTLCILWLGFKLIGRSERSTRLEQLNWPGNPSTPGPQTVRNIFLEDVERARGTLANMEGCSKPLRYRLEGAGMDWTVETFLTNVLISVGLGQSCSESSFRLPARAGVSMTLYGVLASTAPWIVLQYKHSKRMRELEEQLPEAVDFIARHPGRPCLFRSARDALRRRSRADPDGVPESPYAIEPGRRSGDRASEPDRPRPLVDVRFFVSAILLQRETGGNLSEILTSLGNTVRERMRLRGQVRAATAHGRMTAGFSRHHSRGSAGHHYRSAPDTSCYSSNIHRAAAGNMGYYLSNYRIFSHPKDD
jgi:tight adherence protein B